MKLFLKWTKYFILLAGTAENLVPDSKITDTKLYVLVVTLSGQDNINLLKQLQSGFKVTINRTKYLPKKQPKRKTDILMS